MITSTQNQQVKHVIALRKKGKYRRENESYLVEGSRMFFELAPKEIVSVYLSDHYEKLALSGKEKMPAIPYETVSDDVFAQMSDTQTPQGILAVAKMKHYTMEDILTPALGTDAPLVLILENLQDPGNLGTILRSAEAAGVSGILMTEGTVDIYNSKVVRSTMGAGLRVPFMYTENLKQTVDVLRGHKLRIYAAYLDKSTAYDRVDYTDGTAFMIGNEAAGLTKEAVSLSDGKIHIPMLGKVESLNAGVAASLLVYEAARQRRS